VTPASQMEKIVFLDNGQWLLQKAHIHAPHVPKGSCDCGAHSVGSHMHSDWCGGLQPHHKHRFKYDIKHKGFALKDPTGNPHTTHFFDIIDKKDGKKAGIGALHQYGQNSDKTIAVVHPVDPNDPTGISLDSKKWEIPWEDPNDQGIADDFHQHVTGNFKDFLETHRKNWDSHYRNKSTSGQSAANPSP